MVISDFKGTLNPIFFEENGVFLEQILYPMMQVVLRISLLIEVHYGII